uniref:Uncharacterized protein n=1 Tax=Arundo donax TaxID=35708 RepID=A0A0A8Z8H2_ARUDO
MECALVISRPPIIASLLG